MDLHTFLKGSRLNSEILINDYDFNTYKDYKADFDKYLGKANVLSWDACDVVDYEGKEYKEVSISIDMDYIQIKTVWKALIESYIDVLNDNREDRPASTTQYLIDRVEALLPKNCWLNFDGSGYFRLRFKGDSGEEFYFPVELM